MFFSWLFFFSLISLMIISCSRRKKPVPRTSQSKTMMTAVAMKTKEATKSQGKKAQQPSKMVKVVEKKSVMKSVKKNPPKKASSSDSSMSEKTGVSSKTSMTEVTGRTREGSKDRPSKENAEKKQQQTVKKEKSKDKPSDKTEKTKKKKDSEEKTVKKVNGPIMIGDMEVTPEVAELVRKGELLPPNDCATVDDVESQWDVPINK